MHKKKYSLLLMILMILVLSLSMKTAGWSRESSPKINSEYLPNVHWVFCIDTSGSMKMKGHMDL
jgi:Mg-chelatase subunit ChlD